MDNLLTEQDIVRLGKAVGIELSTAQAEHIQAHIRKQLHSFEALDNIDTNGVDPTFDLACEGRFKVNRRCE